MGAPRMWSCAGAAASGGPRTGAQRRAVQRGQRHPRLGEGGGSEQRLDARRVAAQRCELEVRARVRVRVRGRIRGRVRARDRIRVRVRDRVRVRVGFGFGFGLGLGSRLGLACELESAQSSRSISSGRLGWSSASGSAATLSGGEVRRRDPGATNRLDLVKLGFGLD